jgi:pyridoxamine 5'-phosphate oxidase
VRIEGVAERLSLEESDAYFAGRPRVSQLGAWASVQSQPLGSRQELLDRVKELEARFPDVVPRPPSWGGYLVRPVSWEFWQHGEFRLHDRFLYTREGSGWSISRLNP